MMRSAQGRQYTRIPQFRPNIEQFFAQVLRGLHVGEDCGNQLCVSVLINIRKVRKHNNFIYAKDGGCPPYQPDPKGFLSEMWNI
jgi:hypothetical protein